MITTRLEAFTHERHARLLSLGGLLSNALLAEKFFCMLRANGVGVVDATNVIDGDPPNPVDGEGEAKDVDGNPSASRSWQRCSRRC